MNALRHRQLLFEILRDGPDFTDGALELAGDDWNGVVDEAARLDVEALLYKHLGAFAARLPRPVERRLAELYGCNALANRRLHSQLNCILRAFRTGEIQVIPLKGAHLAHLIYDDIAVRPMSDIDLLVPRGEMAAADRLLRTLGYDRENGRSISALCEDRHHLPPFRKPGASMVELHWTIARPSSPFHIDPEHLWRRSERAEITGVGVRVLQPVDLVFHLCLHVGYHHLFGMHVVPGVSLNHLVDIRFVLERFGDRFEWEELVEVADRSGASSVMFCVLDLVRRLIGGPVPTEELERFAPTERDRALVPQLTRVILVPSPMRLSPAVKVLRGRSLSLRGKTAVVLRGLFPPARQMEDIYGLPPGSRRVYLWYLVRPLLLSIRWGRTATSLLLGTRSSRVAVERQAVRQEVESWKRQLGGVSRAS